MGLLSFRILSELASPNYFVYHVVSIYYVIFRVAATCTTSEEFCKTSFLLFRLQTTWLKSQGDTVPYQLGSFSDDVTDFIANQSPLLATPAPLAFLLFLNIPNTFSPSEPLPCYSLYLENSIPHTATYLAPSFCSAFLDHPI